MNNDKEHLKAQLTNMAKDQPQQAVSYLDLFTPQFMQENTNFAAIDFFVKALGAQQFQDIDNIPVATIDKLVKKETKFNSWEEMQQRAVNIYMSKLLN